MELERENKRLKVLIVVLLLVLLGFGGFYYYTTYVKVDDNSKSRNQEIADNDSNENKSDLNLRDALLKRKSILSVSGTDSRFFLTTTVNNLKCGNSLVSPLSVIVDTNGDSYLKVDCMLGTNDSNVTLHENETNAFMSILEETNNIHFEKYNIDSYGEIYAYKLPINNVAMVYNMYFMTGGGYYFVFVLNDGRLAAMTDNEIINYGKINTITFSNLNNILYVTDCGMNGANCEPFAVNSNGEEIYLLKYFQQWFNEYRK